MRAFKNMYIITREREEEKENILYLKETKNSMIIIIARKVFLFVSSSLLRKRVRPLFKSPIL